MRNEKQETRYYAEYDSVARRWQVMDQFMAGQVIGIHTSERAAIAQADTEERYWNIYRTPAEDVALMMA